MSYVPPQTPMSRNDCPTLKEGLESGGRVVVFMDKEAEDETVPNILLQLTMVCIFSSHPCFHSYRNIFLLISGKTNTMLPTLNSLAQSTFLLINDSTW